ncbi:MAG: squalene--hopene cyclase [Akkermansiaceae bacterium]|nr:squalene--hopene cyclase [Akkermansiaceae bacterium]
MRVVFSIAKGARVIGWGGLAVAAGLLHGQSSALRFGTEVSTEVDRVYERGLGWLSQNQGEDGGWKNGQSGPGVDGICVMAFLAGGEEPNFGRWAIPIRKGLRHIILAQDETTGYLPNSMYHHGFAMLALSEAYGAVDEELLWRGAEKRGPAIAKVLQRAIDCATNSQKKNRWGGWRYSPDATDADTSVSGAVLMGLLAARNAGMEVPDATVDGALEYFRRNTGKDGSVAYAGGFGGFGESMNRSCIATLVAAIAKQTDQEKYAATVKHITDRLEHREGGYPEYFRYYMAQALFQCDYEAWKKWNAETIRYLGETQAEDGSFNRTAYSTGMSLLALALNYRFLPIYER